MRLIVHQALFGHAMNFLERRGNARCPTPSAMSFIIDQLGIRGRRC